jgi:hypothetical protein
MDKIRTLGILGTVTRALGILVMGLLLGLINSCNTAEEIIKPKEDPYTLVIKEPKEIHPMTLLGSGPFYISHNPKFGGVFSYQVIMEVSFQHKDHEHPDDLYVMDRKRTKTNLYTLKPELMAMQELLPLEGKPAIRNTFKASLFRGDYDEGGMPVLHDLQVTVNDVLYYKKFKELGPTLPYLSYFLFGSQRELFAAHIISDFPDFDQILTLRLEEGIFSEKQSAIIRRGSKLMFPETMNAFPNALGPGTLGGIVQVHGMGLRVEGEVLEELYFRKLILY